MLPVWDVDIVPCDPVTLERPVKNAEISGSVVRLVVCAAVTLPAFAMEFCRLVTVLAKAICKFDISDPLLAMLCDNDAA